MIVKKLLSLFLLIVICLFLLSAIPALAVEIVASGECGDNLTWTLDSTGTLSISGTGDMADFDFDWAAGESGAAVYSSNIPWNSFHYDGWIGNNKAIENSTIKKAIIADGVTSIGAYAFFKCIGLKDITIPTSVTSIGDNAFSGCTGLTDITIPTNVISIGGNAFHSCSGLSSITIPSRVTTIGKGAFVDCNNLEWLFIPKSVVSIDIYSCSFCQKLTDIYYEGSKEQWNSIKWSPTNLNDWAPDTAFLTATIHFNSVSALGIDFTDVPSGAYYADAVDWAVKHEPQITDGIGNGLFGGDLTVTRGQAMTFLWRAMGKPESASAQGSSFADVCQSDYFNDAVLWAVERGITNGTDNTHFSPDKACSCAEILTFLWRCMGEPDKTSGGAWYEDALTWAGKTGLLAGTVLPVDPTRDCPRRDIVYYLWGTLAPHRYAFVIDDCSWTEAFQNAKAAGGHLVRIEMREEYDGILAQITTRGLTDVQFRIGARRDANSDGYYWVNDDNALFGDKLNNPGHWSWSEWAEGEPSFTWKTTLEDVVELYYDSGLGKWTLNDVPDQGYNGNRYGYIIEYD